MEADNTPGERPVQRQPQPGMAPRPSHPASRRPMVDGFVVHRPNTFGVSPQPVRPLPPAGPVQPAPHTTPIHHAAQPRPHQAVTQQAPTSLTPHQAAAPAYHAQAPRVQANDFKSGDELPQSNATKPPRERNQTGHAGLVGFIAFVLLGVLLTAPLLPGKIFQNFPLSSQSFSTGDQALDCISTQGNITSTTTYTSKAGSPLNYTYATKTTQSAACDGSNQSAVTGHTSMFSPLALLIDVLIALVVAIVVSKIWKRFFGEKPHKH